MTAPPSDKLSPRGEQLLAQLEEIFFEQGYRRITVGALAARLRCSRATLYALAPSKEELFLRVLDRVLGMMWIARYLLQVTKWKSVILSSVRGTGTGGAARSVVSRKKRQSDPNPTSDRLT